MCLRANPCVRSAAVRPEKGSLPAASVSREGTVADIADRVAQSFRVTGSSPATAERAAMGGSGAASSSEPLYLRPSLRATSSEPRQPDLMLIKPTPDDLPLIRILDKKCKEGLLALDDPRAVETLAKAHLASHLREQEVKRLVHTALQYALFQTSIGRLPKTNENLSDVEREIIGKLELAMKTKRLNISDAAEVYSWTIAQIITSAVPNTLHIKVVRAVTNYVNTRTYGKDWPKEDILVMKDLSDALREGTLDVRESDPERATAVLTAWLDQSFRKYEISSVFHTRIAGKVQEFVQKFRDRYQALNTHPALDGKAIFAATLAN